MPAEERGQTRRAQGQQPAADPNRLTRQMLHSLAHHHLCPTILARSEQVMPTTKTGDMRSCPSHPV